MCNFLSLTRMDLAVTDDFILRLERVRAENYRIRNETQGALANTPVPCGVAGFGKAQAWFTGENARIHWLDESDPEQLADIEKWAAEHGLKVLHDVPPTVLSRPVATRLSGGGYQLVSWQPILWRSMEGLPATPDGEVEVEALGANPNEEFVETFIRAHEWFGGDVPLWARVIPLTWKAEDAQCFVARQEGKPVAAATLVVLDGVARLANSATIKEHRGKGAQTALIHARLKAAYDAGLEVATADAVQNGVSLRNLSRAGFVVAAHVTQWRKPEA